MYNNHKKGFGLLEVLLAGLIIIIMLSALVVVARAAISNSLYLQQRSQATFLAQEGMEIVRQIRDTNYIDGSNNTTWNAYDQAVPTSGKINTAKFYGIDFASGRWKLLSKNDEASVASMTFSGVTYRRVITFSDTGSLVTNPALTTNPNFNAPAYRLKVAVTWSFQGQDGKTVEIEEILANSRQGL